MLLTTAWLLFAPRQQKAPLGHWKIFCADGKSSKYQMNEKDYMLGAMSLYSDIVNIFLYILRLLGEIDDRNN